MAAEIAGELRARAARIRLACFDVDGTLTDGRLWLDADGREAKAFSVLDGQGLRLLEDNGVAVALITARDSPAVTARARDLGLDHVFQGVKDKAACLLALSARLGIAPEDVAYFGDDLADLPALRLVGLAAGPANAHPWLHPYLHWITAQRGGEGAARALCDLVLEARGLRDIVLARYGG